MKWDFFYSEQQRKNWSTYLKRYRQYGMQRWVRRKDAYEFNYVSDQKLLPVIKLVVLMSTSLTIDEVNQIEVLLPADLPITNPSLYTSSRLAETPPAKSRDKRNQWHHSARSDSVELHLLISTRDWGSAYRQQNGRAKMSGHNNNYNAIVVGVAGPLIFLILGGGVGILFFYFFVGVGGGSWLRVSFPLIAAIITIYIFFFFAKFITYFISIYSHFIIKCQ